MTNAWLFAGCQKAESSVKDDKDGENDIREFLRELIDKLRFPGLLSIDGHGFMEDKTGEPVFIYGSPNSTIRLWNCEQSVFLERKVRKKNTVPWTLVTKNLEKIIIFQIFHNLFKSWQLSENLGLLFHNDSCGFHSKMVEDSQWNWRPPAKWIKDQKSHFSSHHFRPFQYPCV